MLWINPHSVCNIHQRRTIPEPRDGGSRPPHALAVHKVLRDCVEHNLDRLVADLDHLLARLDLADQECRANRGRDWMNGGQRTAE